jgi:hypothetical protein
MAIIDAKGEVLANRNVPNGAEPILKVIGGLPPGTPAAFEAAHGTSWLVELLEDYGFDPHLVHPSRCKAIASSGGTAGRLADADADAELRAGCGERCPAGTGSVSRAGRELSVVCSGQQPQFLTGPVALVGF